MNNQPITPQHLSSAYRVSDVFYTIQGEGPWVGFPAVFVRLAGCNLQCTWCDTDYSVQHRIEVHALIQSVVDLWPHKTPPRVIITGGEPFVHDLVPLVHGLYSLDCPVQIETNGTLTNPYFPWFMATIVCSPKAGKIHDDIVQNCRNYKFVVGVEDAASPNGFPRMPTQKGGKRPPPHGHLRGQFFVMPRDDKDGKTDNLQAAVKIALKHELRLCLQTHKIIGVD